MAADEDAHPAMGAVRPMHPKEDGMRTLCKLVLLSGVAMVAAAFPAMAQQGQPQMPMAGMMG